MCVPPFVKDYSLGLVGQGRSVFIYIIFNFFVYSFHKHHKIVNRTYFAYHWERRMIDGTIYRHNNIADPKARTLKTFPKHFHEGDDEAVKESRISDKPEEAIREFLEFAREKIKGKK